MSDKNNWYVITGGPCAGKTSVLKILEQMGYRVQYEEARIYIDEKIAEGRSIGEIRKDEAAFQREVLRRKIEVEKNLPAKEMILFDRGVPDSVAYFELIGLSDDAGELRRNIVNSRYKKIFLLDLLDFEGDYSRIEDCKTANNIQKLLEKTYRDLGFEVVNVPVPKSNKKEDRADFIIQNLQQSPGCHKNY